MTAPVRVRHLTEANLAGRRWRGLVRESTERQADRWSPERQRQDIRRAADELSMVGVEPLFYERVGSGEAVGAPELRQALDDARRGEYDVLVLLTTSRFARNVLEARRLKAAFREAGVVIYFAIDRILSGSRTGRLTEGLREVLDEEENEVRRMWVSGGMRQRQSAGRWVGNVPFGLRKVLADRPDGTRGWDGEIEPDPVTGPIVRSIFDAFVAGQGSKAIAFDLNARAVRTTTGAPWRPGTVDKILANPAYIGRLVRYGRRRSNHYYDHDSDDGHVDLGERFPALVDPLLFEQVAKLRATRTRPRGRLGRRRYPMSGTLRCRRCGHTMTGVSAKGLRYYRCNGRRTFGVCDAPSIRADVAEAAFSAWLGSYRLPDDWRTAIARTLARETRPSERDRQTVLKERLRRLQRMYSWGDIQEAEYRAQVAEIKTVLGVVAMPSRPGNEAVAAALSDLGRAWSFAPPDRQAALPSLMLKSADVEDGRVATWVVDAGLRPLLDLCVVVPNSYATIGG
jgi:site-specific DNA recombinase